MNESNNRTKLGYVLRKVELDSWQFITDFGTFKGDLRRVFHYAIQQLGFEFNEMETAVIEMNNSDSDSAEFGVMKKFIYCFNHAGGSK